MFRKQEKKNKKKQKIEKKEKTQKNTRKIEIEFLYNINNSEKNTNPKTELKN